MRRPRALHLVAAMLLAGAGIGTAVYAQAGSEPPPAAQPDRSVQRVLFQVDGLSCGSCEGKVRKALSAKPGVRGVDVNLDEKTVTVEYQEGAADPKDLADAITRLGYPARYLASGPSVAPVRTTSGRTSGGCGGDCCKGRGS